MKKIVIVKPIFFALAFLITGCSINTEIYKTRNPQFVMNEFFSGELCAWGVVRDDDNVAIRKFVTEIIATEKDGKIVLDENFLFDDGEKQTRIWKFYQQDKKSQEWIGTAGDVIGEAKGKIIGDSMSLDYQLEIKHNGEPLVVSMQDWLHLIDKHTLIASTDISKWGFNVGRIDLLIRKQSLSSCILKVDTDNYNELNPD